MRFRSLQFPPDPKSLVPAIAKTVLGDLPDDVVVVFDIDDEWRFQMTARGGFRKDARLAPGSRDEQAVERLLREWRASYDAARQPVA